MADQKDYKLVKRQIFVRRGAYLEHYPFAFVKSIDLRSGVVEWSGMMPDFPAVHHEKDRMLYRDGDNVVFIDPNPWILEFDHMVSHVSSNPNALCTGINPSNMSHG